MTDTLNTPGFNKDTNHCGGRWDCDLVGSLPVLFEVLSALLQGRRVNAFKRICGAGTDCKVGMVH